MCACISQKQVTVRYSSVGRAQKCLKLLAAPLRSIRMSHPLAHPFSRIAACLEHAANRADWRRGALRRHPQPRVRLSHVPPRRPHGRRQRRQGLVRLVLRAPRRVQDHAQHLGTWRWTARGTVGEKQCARVCVLDPPAGCKKSNKTHTLGTCLLCFPRGLCRT